MPIIIKNVWISAGPLKAADRFNIYSWCALGHSVDIYTHHPSHGTFHTHKSLGLEACEEIGVTDIGKLFEVDYYTIPSQEVEAMRKEVELIIYLLKVFPTTWKKVKKIAQLYNLVDMVKSYIGATRQGIVLDTKVGPSEHLQHYEKEFAKKFVSYKRGGQASIVENQCIGTMQKENLSKSKSMRYTYAKKFADNMERGQRVAMKENPTSDHYNLITSLHGRAWKKVEGHMDVSRKGPGGKNINLYKFFDFIGQWNGPFRVFKEPSSQTHRDRKSKGAEYVKILCKDVLRDFNKKKYTPKFSEPHPNFLQLMKKTIDEIK